MNEFKKKLLDEIPEFRERGHQFLRKEMSMMDFKHISGGMGVYAQRGGEKFMIRLRVFSGVLNIEQLKLVQYFAHKYNLEKIHLTTRQAIQLHDLTIDEVCDIMEEAIHKDMYTRGGGGNFPRNVALSPLSGVDPDEYFDVTPYADKVSEYFMKRIITYKLPRKLKVSFSSCDKDTSNATINDMGFLATEKNGEKYFELYLAGGIGKNPQKGVKYPELVKPNEILYYVDAMVKLFMAEGDYENRNKARTRYIVMRMGEEAFLNRFNEFLEESKRGGGLDINIEFKDCKKLGVKISPKHKLLFAQKQEGLYSVYIHPINGQLKVSDLDRIIDLIESMEDVEVRLSMSEGMFIRNLNGSEAIKVLELNKDITGDLDIYQSTACIGVPTCQVGIAQSQHTLESILNYMNEKGLKDDVLPKIHISGCTNSCSTHQIAKMGFAGKKKRVGESTEDAFEVYAGGSVGKNNTKLGVKYGEILAKDLPSFLYELAMDIKESSLKFEDYLKNEEGRFKEIVDRYNK